MSRDKFKARGRVTQKMTRDGLVERNESTGGENRISKRDADFDIRGVKTDETIYSRTGGRIGEANTARNSHNSTYQQFRHTQESEYQTAQHDRIRDADFDIRSVKAHETTYSGVGDRISETNTTRNRHNSTYQQFSHTQETEYQTTQHDQIRYDTPQSKTVDVLPDITRVDTEYVPDMQHQSFSHINHTNVLHTDVKPGKPYTPVRERQDRQIETPKRHDNVQQRRYDETYRQFHQPQVTESQKPTFHTDTPTYEPQQSQQYMPLRYDPYNDVNQTDPANPAPEIQHRNHIAQASKLQHDEPIKVTESVQSHSLETTVQIESIFNPDMSVVDASQDQHDAFAQTGHRQDAPTKKSKLKTQRESTYNHNKDYGLQQNKPETLQHSSQSVEITSNATQSVKITAEQAKIITTDAERKINNLSEMTPDEKREIRKASTYRQQKVDAASQASHQSEPIQNVTPVPITTGNLSDITGDIPESTLKSSKEGKLHFSDGETISEKPKSRKLVKAEYQYDKASGKLEKANKKLPSKRKLRSERVFDEKSGKAKRKLYFEREVKPQGEHLKGAIPLRPVKAGLNAAIVFGHKKIFQVEHENVELKAAHRGEMVVEGGVRAALHHHKTAPYRQTAKLQHKAMKKQANLNHKQALEKKPKKKNFISRAWHKRKIKKNYAKKTRNAQKTAKGATTIVQKAGALAVKAFKVIAMNPKVKIVLLLLIFLVLLMYSMCNSMGGLGIGGVGGVTATTFLAADADMLGAEAIYAGMEAELQNYLDNYESLNPGYDEYRYELDSIWHDPYVLISIISALHEGEWTLGEVQGTLTMLFDMQYTLTETVTVEVRTRTAIGIAIHPVTGEEYEYEYIEAYNYYIITVTLDNFDLSRLPVYIMGEDRLSRYALLMWTHGNRPDLFQTSQFPFASYPRDFERYEIPPEALSDPVFAAIIAEAEKYLGYPYVWGGSSPSTSFDCSGYVSWVLNNTFWNVGRLTARGLYNICTPVSPANARPGDLVFFWRTYNAPDPNAATHVGIYVGNGMMIHCGNPISYASINTTYWQNHFFGFGRLP